jgi:hypothetical protein
LARACAFIPHCFLWLLTTHVILDWFGNAPGHTRTGVRVYWWICSVLFCRPSKADSLLYPGVPAPGEKRLPVRWGDFSILTSHSRNAWRVTEKGVRNDTAFPWRNDPENKWQECVDYVRAGDKRRKAGGAEAASAT